jgi:hypothetical protein
MALGLFALVIPAQAQRSPKCSSISGVSVETIAPASQAPNDPFGRIIGIFTGDFAGVTNASFSAILTTPPAFSPASGAPSVMQIRHVFSTGPGDTVITLGKTVFIPSPIVLPTALALNPGTVPGTNAAPIQASQCPGTPCVITISQVLDIIGGTGRFEGVTGQLRNLGQGNVDLLNGKGQFIFADSGEVCFPR